MPTSPAAAAHPLSTRALAGLAAATAIVHALTNAASPYGVHRDELLYLAMGRHLRLWAMDFPPFVVPEERRAWVFVCDGPRRSLQQVWPSLAGRN